MKTCKDCIYYAESKPFKHPRHKKETYFSLCKARKRLHTRFYGLEVRDCKDFKEIKE